MPDGWGEKGQRGAGARLVGVAVAQGGSCGGGGSASHHDHRVGRADADESDGMSGVALK